MISIYFAACYFLLLFSSHVTAQAPTCPNGQQPKLDVNFLPIQCLPGISQHSICGPNHNCYFTGINYMCCPSNEPSIDNQPNCPYPKLTVLDPHGLPMKCSPISRMCPEEHMHCSDVGLGFICCEDPSFQRKQKKIATTTRRPNIIRPKTTTPPSLDSLECPSQSIGLLKSDGSRMTCNSRLPCPGDDTFCHGENGRSICCQKYLYAEDILDPKTKSAEKIDNRKTTTRKPISMSIVRPLPRNMHEGQFVKKPISTTTRRIVTTTTTTPVTTTEKVFEIPQIAINSIGVRRSGPLPSMRKESEFGGDAEVTRTWTPKSSFNFPTEPVATSTIATIATTTTRRPIPPGLVARRNRIQPQGLSNTNSKANEFQPASIDLSRNSMNHQDRHDIAQKLLSYQIRNGWPYDERFYRPDTDIYTDEQKTEIARMRFLPQHN